MLLHLLTLLLKAKENALSESMFDTFTNNHTFYPSTDTANKSVY
ncbi:hypothetical protein PPHE_a1934 [Pseudoalteromonas phenolica O-BC30]|nr:hypothetical protein [Pseudoalteromonas phenolica O-BC30]